jgi:hypothetical protein
VSWLQHLSGGLGSSVYRPIVLTRFPAMFSTYSLRSVKATADGPSSLSGGFGIKLRILVSFKSKLRTESMWALDAYNRESEDEAGSRGQPLSQSVCEGSKAYQGHAVDPSPPTISPEN